MLRLCPTSAHEEVLLRRALGLRELLDTWAIQLAPDSGDASHLTPRTG